MGNRVEDGRLDDDILFLFSSLELPTQATGHKIALNLSVETL